MHTFSYKYITGIDMQIYIKIAGLTAPETGFTFTGNTDP
jgi:hypothetical protein